MPWWGYHYTPITQKEPLERKKERKKNKQAQVQHRRWVKWLNQEPPRWKIIAWIRWRMNEPKGC